MRQIVLDTETTGLSSENGDRIIEIGCVELLNRKLTGSHLHFYLNPGRDSHEDALRVHGIRNEFLRDKPAFGAVAQQLLDYLAGAQIIIHNAPFDLGFLDRELELAGRPPLARYVASVVDTLVMAKEMFPGKRNSLDALCDRLDVDNSARSLHGALLDAELLADVYVNMTRGQEALLIETGPTHEPIDGAEPIDLSRFDLPVVPASAAERMAHAAVLLALDKSSGGRTVWPLEDRAAVVRNDEVAMA